MLRIGIGAKLEGKAMHRQFIRLSIIAVLACSGCVMEVEDDVSMLESSSTSLEYGVAAHVFLSCYVDTPAYDEYSQDRCSAFGTQPSWASFQLTPHAPPSYVEWWIYDNNGNEVAQSCSGVTCSVPILPGQTLQAGTYYIANGIPTQGAAATAVYRYNSDW
jgi:hypothetical protein